MLKKNEYHLSEKIEIQERYKYYSYHLNKLNLIKPSIITSKPETPIRIQTHEKNQNIIRDIIKNQMDYNSNLNRNTSRNISKRSITTPLQSKLTGKNDLLKFK